eukprot:6173027-Pleurochrysis_carterae.AAC.1
MLREDASAINGGSITQRWQRVSESTQRCPNRRACQERPWPRTVSSAACCSLPDIRRGAHAPLRPSHDRM